MTTRRFMKTNALILAAALCMTSLACGGNKPDAHSGATKKAKPAKTKPTPKAKRPTPATKANTTAAARAILDRLETAGLTYTTLRTDIVYEVRNRMTGEVEARTGWVAYQKETKDQPAKFRVHFDTLRLEDGPKTRNKVDYIYDGQYVTKDQYKTKTRTRWQVAAKGERVEALRIGKGPFPVPFGQKTEDVLQYLRAVTRKPAPADLPNTDYLKLTPLPGKAKDVNFTRLEMWIDKKNNLPTRIRTRDENKNVKTVTFQNTKTHAKIDPKLFDVPKPRGFEMIVQRLGK